MKEEIRNYDLIVIGGGPAGFNAAAMGCGDGLRVLLVEKNELGGTCLNRGCIPTKSFCASAEVARTVTEALSYGIALPGEGTFEPDMPAIVNRKESIVASLREGVAMLVSGADVAKGDAVFEAPKVVRVCQGIDGLRCSPSYSFLATAPKIIVATGSESSRLDIEGADLAIDSTAMLELSRVPESLAVIGGGVIGMEFASIFAALGSEVTVLEYCKEILPPFDKEIAKRLRSTLQRRGVKFHLGARVQRIAAEGIGGAVRRVDFECKGKEASVGAEAVLMAVGRRPVVPAGMAENGFNFTERGFLETDAGLETSVEGVYAVGDCNGLIMLAHAAEAQASMVMRRRVNMSVIPSAVFAMPECAMVGRTEEQCVSLGLKVRVGKAFFRANGKACAMGETDGLVKVILNEQTDLMEGCHICGPHASDLIAEAALAMSAALPADVMEATVHSHPSLSEALLAAVRQA